MKHTLLDLAKLSSTVIVRIEFLRDGVLNQEFEEVKNDAFSELTAAKIFAEKHGLLHVFKSNAMNLHTSVKSLTDKSIYRVTQVEKIGLY